MEKTSDEDCDNTNVNYDKILDHIGQFGSFQRKIFFWLSFVSAAAGLAVVTFAFTGKMTKKSKYFYLLDCLQGLSLVTGVEWIIVMARMEDITLITENFHPSSRTEPSLSWTDASSQR